VISGGLPFTGGIHQMPNASAAADFGTTTCGHGGVVETAAPVKHSTKTDRMLPRWLRVGGSWLPNLQKCAMDMSWIFLNRVPQLLSDPVFVALQDGTLRRWCFGLVQWFRGVSFGTARGTSQKYPPSWNRKVVISFMDQ